MLGTYLAFVPLDPPGSSCSETDVPDRVPQSSRSCPIVGKAVDDPLVNPFHRKQLVRRVFNRHEGETTKGIGGLVRAEGGQRVSRREDWRHLWLFGQQVDLGERLKGEQVAAPLMQPAQAGQVALVGWATAVCFVFTQEDELERGEDWMDSKVVG